MQYINLVDTAKIIRAKLKESFPGVKFSVKGEKYAGGASIHIEYLNGPIVKEVEKLVKPFEGCRFDPMTDMKEYNRTYRDGVEVGYASDYVFVRRELSYAATLAVATEVAKEYGQPVPTVTPLGKSAYISSQVRWGDEFASTVVYQKGLTTDFR